MKAVIKWNASESAGSLFWPKERARFSSSLYSLITSIEQDFHFQTHILIKENKTKITINADDFKNSF